MPHEISPPSLFAWPVPWDLYFSLFAESLASWDLYFNRGVTKLSMVGANWGENVVRSLCLAC